MIGFHYETEESQKGFEYDDPLTIDAFATLLLNSKNQQNKPFLTIYTSEQIMEYIKPPFVMPQPCEILDLIDEDTIDPLSPIIKCGCLRINSDGKIDMNSISVLNKHVTVGRDGKISKQCKIYKDALKRYISKKKRERKEKQKVKKSYYYSTGFENNYDETPDLISYGNGTFDPNSRVVLNGSLKLTNNNRIDKRFKNVRDGTVKLKKNGDIDGRSKYAREHIIKKQNINGF